MGKRFNLSAFCIAFALVLFSIDSKAQSNFLKPTISIGVLVENLDKSLDFYTKVVGMVKVREFVVDAAKAKRMGLSDTDKFDIKVLKLEDSEYATELKLMSFQKRTNHSKQKFLTDANGIRYLTIFVHALQPVLDKIKNNGIKTLGQSPTMLDEKRQFVLIQDPDGNFIEFISAS